MNIGIFSFFTGAGFLDLGFETVKGFKTLFVNEFHPPFMDIYKATREKMEIPGPIYGHSTQSITEFVSGSSSEWLSQKVNNAKKEFEIVGFIGGPPCPDFSVGGKNKGIEGENGKLSASYFDLIIQNQPDFFLFENVKGLYRTKKHKEFFNASKEKLSQAGYFMTERLINSLEYGAPQDRERIILIGFNKNIIGIENPSTKEAHRWLLDFDWYSRTSYPVEDLKELDWPTTNNYGEDSTLPPPSNIPLELTVEHWFQSNSVYEHENARHHFTPRAALSKFKTIKEGDDSKKSTKRLHRWRYSPTAAYGNNEVHLHPYKTRRLSVSEALAIQTLPKNFTIPEHISLTNMFKTIGNGVPYVAAKGLALTILDFLSSADLNSRPHENAQRSRHSKSNL